MAIACDDDLIDQGLAFALAVCAEAGDILRKIRSEGRVAVAVYPWEVSVAPGTPEANGRNAIAGPIVGLDPEGDRVRVRVGELSGECPAGDAERLDLQRGDPVTLLFDPANARIVDAPPGG